MATFNCDGCMACCTALPIVDIILIKEENVVCKHCDKGCSIYENRPQSCVNFNCVYVQDGYDTNLRPDKSGVIFEKITTRIYLALILKDNLDTWQTEPMMDHIKSLNDSGISVVVSSFSTGIINTFCAKDHNKSMVIDIALRSRK